VAVSIVLNILQKFFNNHQLMEAIEAATLLSMWVIPHILILRLARVPSRSLTVIVCVVLLAGAYLLKPATSDLSRYSVYFNSGFLTDKSYSVTNEGNVEIDPLDSTGDRFLQAFDANPGFRYVARLMDAVSLNRPFLPRLTVFKKRYITDGPVVVIMLIGLLGVLFSCSRLLQKSQGSGVSIRHSYIVLYWVPLILGSMFFMLGSQNALRQFLGIVFVMIGIIMLLERRVFWFVIASAVAISFHQWSLVFVGIMFGLITGKSVCAKIFQQDSIGWNLATYGIAGVTLGCVGVVAVKAVVGGVLETINAGPVAPLIANLMHTAPIYSEVKQYVGMDSSELLSRMSGINKIALLGGLIVLSEIVLGRASLPTRWDIRGYRIGIYAFLAPFALYPEILSRLVLFYLLVEALFICMAVLSNERRARIAGSLIFFAYGVAPNGITILLGREWLTKLY
jgi:hypothetical protein